MSRTLVLIVAVLSINAFSNGAEFTLVGGDAPKRLSLQIEIDGKSVASLWEEGCAALLAHFDLDNSGSLDAKEAARLPSAFGLRQVLSGDSRFAQPAPPWKQLDRNGDGKATLRELMDYYASQGVTSPLVVFGEPPFTRRLSDALWERLDTNGDGKLTEAEVRKAESLLARLDRNADERIAVGELVAQATYPGVDATTVMMPPSDLGVQPPAAARLPLRLQSHGDARIDYAWRVRLGRDTRVMDSENGWLTATWAGVVLRLRADPGRLDESLATQRRQLEAHFAAADLDADGKLTPKELDNPSFLSPRLILPWADRDGDGALTRSELKAWISLFQKLTRGAVMVTLLDHGQGLFEMLDADHDGWLSQRELRGAWNRLTQASCVTDGMIVPAKLPRTLLACVSRGWPRDPLATRPPRGPEWFRAMDRNGDGDVSAREWIGDPALFRQLDRDGDGLLSPEEAAQLKTQ